MWKPFRAWLFQFRKLSIGQSDNLPERGCGWIQRGRGGVRRWIRGWWIRKRGIHRGWIVGGRTRCRVGDTGPSLALVSVENDCTNMNHRDGVLLAYTSCLVILFSSHHDPHQGLLLSLLPGESLHNIPIPAISSCLAFVPVTVVDRRWLCVTDRRSAVC